MPWRKTTTQGTDLNLWAGLRLQQARDQGLGAGLGAHQRLLHHASRAKAVLHRGLRQGQAAGREEGGRGSGRVHARTDMALACSSTLRALRLREILGGPGQGKGVRGW